MVDGSQTSLLAALRADLRARYPDADRWSTARRIARFVTDPSLQAALTLRLALLSRGRLIWLWRTWSIMRFRSEFFRCKVGPGVHMPKPFNIVLARGTTLGRNVTLHEGASIGFPRSERPGERLDSPTVGDRVVVGAYSVLAGPIHVGSDTLLERGAYVDEDVAPGSVVPGQPLPGPPAAARDAPVSAGAAPPAPVSRLLAADYAALYRDRSRHPGRLAVRLLTNPSLHAAIMIRLALAAPRPLAGALLAALRIKHCINSSAGAGSAPGSASPIPTTSSSPQARGWAQTSCSTTT